MEGNSDRILHRGLALFALERAGVPRFPRCPWSTSSGWPRRSSTRPGSGTGARSSDTGRWLRRWSGERTFERIWLPLLKSKLGENYRLTSAAFIWATIARMYAARRPGLKREMFGYVEGGYDRS